MRVRGWRDMVEEKGLRVRNKEMDITHFGRWSCCAFGVAIVP